MSVEAATTAAAAASATEIVKLLASLAKPPEPNPYIPALIGLGGVLVGALLQIGGNELAALRHRRAEARKASDAAAISALHLARHLEAYSLQMNSVIISWNMCDWYEPNKWRNHFGEEPVYFSPLGIWPKIIDWKAIPTSIVVEAENYFDLTTVERIKAREFSALSDAVDMHRISAETASRLGPMAWNFSQRIRDMFMIAPLTLGEGSDMNRLAQEFIEANKRYEASMQSLDALEDNS